MADKVRYVVQAAVPPEREPHDWVDWDGRGQFFTVFQLAVDEAKKIAAAKRFIGERIFRVVERTERVAVEAAVGQWRERCDDLRKALEFECGKRDERIVELEKDLAAEKEASRQ